MNDLIVVWVEYLDAEGKILDTHYEMPESVAEAFLYVAETTRFPFRYEVAVNGLMLVGWTNVLSQKDLPFIPKGDFENV